LIFPLRGSWLRSTHGLSSRSASEKKGGESSQSSASVRAFLVPDNSWIKEVLKRKRVVFNNFSWRIGCPSHRKGEKQFFSLRDQAILENGQATGYDRLRKKQSKYMGTVKTRCAKQGIIPPILHPLSLEVGRTKRKIPPVTGRERRAGCQPWGPGGEKFFSQKKNRDSIIDHVGDKEKTNDSGLGALEESNLKK